MMPKRSVKVVSIRQDILASDEVHEVADLAYNLWLANGFRGGSPEEALVTAIRHVRTRPAAWLFLVPKRNSVRRNVYPFSRVVLN